MAEQRWNAVDYAAHARFVSDLAGPVLDLLEMRAGERILDLGCGDGALTEELAARGARVTGIDSSPAMVAAARARGVEAAHVDARALPFRREFDAVFSNAVFHWIPDLSVVFKGVHRALKPAGRFVGECGGHGCVAAICTALSAVAQRRGLVPAMPWRFRTPEELEEALVTAGFEPTRIALVPRPTLLASGMDPWLRIFAGWLFEPLPPAEREAALAETVELLRPVLCDSRGRWTADYVRLRFAARKDRVRSR